MRRALVLAVVGTFGISLAACHSASPKEHNDTWQSGSDYIELTQPLGAPPRAGKVNVTVYFVTTAPYWPKFRPEYERWLQTKPDYIDSKLSPAIVYPNARSQARAFLTLRKMGRDDLFNALFAWIWQKDHYPIYHTVMRPDDAGMAKLSLEFAEANGLQGSEFSAIYSSAEMDERVAYAEIETHLAAASTAVVNGKLASDAARLSRDNPADIGSPATSQKLFKLVDYLAARELDNHKQSASGR